MVEFFVCGHSFVTSHLLQVGHHVKTSPSSVLVWCFIKMVPVPVSWVSGAGGLGDEQSVPLKYIKKRCTLIFECHHDRLFVVLVTITSKIGYFVGCWLIEVSSVAIIGAIACKDTSKSDASEIKKLGNNCLGSGVVQVQEFKNHWCAATLDVRLAIVLVPLLEVWATWQVLWVDHISK